MPPRLSMRSAKVSISAGSGASVRAVAIAILGDGNGTWVRPQYTAAPPAPATRAKVASPRNFFPESAGNCVAPRAGTAYHHSQLGEYLIQSGRGYRPCDATATGRVRRPPRIADSMLVLTPTRRLPPAHPGRTGGRDKITCRRTFSSSLRPG